MRAAHACLLSALLGAHQGVQAQGLAACVVRLFECIDRWGMVRIDWLATHVT